MMHHARTPIPSASTAPFIPLIADDTEEAPWMVMGDAQFWAASHLATALDHYAVAHRRPWYVASMLPILYRRPRDSRIRQVAPDILVSFVPRHRRDSYDLESEGVFPAFVLEVLSPSSAGRDRVRKRRLYEALGAQEYVLFAPEPGLLMPPMQGYRRTPAGRFERWLPNQNGRLWSAVLELELVVEGELVRARQADGQPLLTYAESEAARQHETEARRRAEEEAARLRVALEQFKADR